MKSILATKTPPTPDTTPSESLDGIAIRIAERMGRNTVRLRKTMQECVDIGRDLLQAKQIAGHGEFMDWLDHNPHFDLAQSSANNYMAVARWVDANGVDVSTYTSMSQLVAAASGKALPDGKRPDDASDQPGGNGQTVIRNDTTLESIAKTIGKEILDIVQEGIAGGAISVEGESKKITDENIIKALLERVGERKGRQITHIIENTGRKPAIFAAQGVLTVTKDGIGIIKLDTSTSNLDTGITVGVRLYAVEEDADGNRI